MHHIHAELDPETGTKVLTAIRATLTALEAPPTGIHTEPTPPSRVAVTPIRPAQRDQIIARALTSCANATDEPQRPTTS